MSYEDGLEEFRVLLHEHEQGTLISTTATESDTRAKLVTRILTRVLGWPEPQIDRETVTNSGYIDYVLKAPNPLLLVEAKRVGKTFVFPAEKKRRRYALSGLRSEKSGVGKAVRQVRQYADDQGVEYACASNGTQWIIFRAITRGAPWSKGKGVVFRNLHDIYENFTEFWNLISFEAVGMQSLRAEFARDATPRLEFRRPIASLPWGDAKEARNPLSNQLQPIVNAFFKDLTGVDQDSLLERCYVHDRRVEGLVDQVQDVVLDTIPNFAANAGFQDLAESRERSGALDSEFRRAVALGQYGTTVLLLGGVGCGKTTFIHRFLRLTARDLLADRCVWFSVPFTEAPVSSEEFGEYARRSILTSLRERYPELVPKKLTQLRQIYDDEITELRSGVWELYDDRERRDREARFLEERVASAHHCDAVLKHLRRSGRAIAIVLDNIDQRLPDEQVRVFLLGHELCRALDAIVMVALREESYFRADQAGAFNAYHNLRYHIASPDPRKVLIRRIDYTTRLFRRGEADLREATGSLTSFDTHALSTIFRLVRSSVTDNPAIVNFIDAMGGGDTRAALDMFNTFMVSGATHFTRMLEQTRIGRGWTIAEHEFVKAVMLGDYQFYRGDRSEVLNLFEISGSPRASNLTCLRVLYYLRKRQGELHAEGPGFVNLLELSRAFEDTFGSSDDLHFHLIRLIQKRLVETDNRQVEGLVSVKSIAATRKGLYYINTLAGRFQYLQLASMDTPIWHSQVEHQIRRFANPTSIYDRVEQVEWFIRYLQLEEARTIRRAPKALAEEFFSTTIASDIEHAFRRDLSRVRQKAHLDGGLLASVQQRVAQDCVDR
ncbi:MAG: hypothetical protein RLP09_07420 [Sandaracinaceae bacterium]